MEENFIDKLVQHNYVSDIRRFAIGALLAASIGWGWPAFVATGVVATAISGAEFYYDRKSKQKSLLGLYKDDIAALENKHPEDVTLDDLQKAAAPVKNGGHGIKAIKEGLDRYDWDRRFRWGVNLSSSLIVTAALVGLAIVAPAFLANISTILGLGLVGLGYLAVNRSIRAVGEMAFGHQDREERFNQQLIDISHAIKKEPLSPVLIFREFAEANPQLNEDIKQKFGSHFDDLTVMQKRQAVDAYESQYRVVELTNEINEGRIRPSIIGFLAYDQGCKGTPDCDKYRKLFSNPIHTVAESEQKYESSGSFAQRLERERQVKAEKEKTLH